MLLSNALIKMSEPCLLAHHMRHVTFHHGFPFSTPHLQASCRPSEDYNQHCPQALFYYCIPYHLPSIASFGVHPRPPLSSGSSSSTQPRCLLRACLQVTSDDVSALASDISDSCSLSNDGSVSLDAFGWPDDSNMVNVYFNSR